ncbi:MAG: MBL fold metallo-hydrolase [Acidobacteria bacterium]|nr:MBL fold metallo-hydrolase [Acidobacteriota bacterium]
MTGNKLEVVVVAENTVRGAGLLGEHGLAFWINANGRSLLFDTGQGKVLAENTRHLGIHLGKLEAVAISHGHYDHTGGLHTVLERSRQAEVYVHPAAFHAKYSRQQAPPHRKIGMPRSDKVAVQSGGHDVIWTVQPCEIFPRLWVTGEIPRITKFEDAGGPFYLDRVCTQPDPLADDQALFVESANGIIVLLGCAHAGVVNTLEYISRVTGRKRIHAVLGGMHLLRASRKRIEATGDALERFQVRVIAPGHCTGPAAVAYFWNRFPSRVKECATGSRFVFQ